jgi:hypothetical protein
MTVSNHTNQSDGELTQKGNHFVFHNKLGKNSFGVVHLVVDDTNSSLDKIDPTLQV